MIYLPANLMLILILTATAIAASALYIREYFLRKSSYQQQQKELALTKQKSIQLLNAAEMAETQLISKNNFVTQKLISEFKTQLKDIIKHSEKTVTTSQDQLIKFMSNLQKRGVEFEEASKAATQQRINQLFERLETKLSDFLIQTEQKTTSSIELELTATRQLIDTYKSEQFKLIDENIIAMMEQTLNIVLGKKLSLKDQLDLVYEALEKAKVEKFII